MEGMYKEMRRAYSAAGKLFEVHLDLQIGAFRTLLAESASQHDLLVIGRRTGNGLSRAIGTWSTLSIVEHAAGTVLVVPEAATS